MQRTQKLMHADSLSSDPSDTNNKSKSLNDDQRRASLLSNNNGTTENAVEHNEHSRKPSAKNKRTRPGQRKQPPIPINSNNDSGLQQRLNFKQHSLTSSDENINESVKKSALNRFSANMKANSLANNTKEMSNEDDEYEQNNYLGDEEENEENMNDEEEEEEEIRSTTEYTTNDEMDLESGSINMKPNQYMNRAGEQSTMTKIDDYLEQNLRKEEILAAKMTKFLSVCCFIYFNLVHFIVVILYLKSCNKHTRFALEVRLHIY